MFFTLNRVGFDHLKQGPVKNDSRFEFDKTIYLDYFLHKVKDKVNSNEEEMNKLKEKVIGLKQAMTSYDNWA